VALEFVEKSDAVSVFLYPAPIPEFYIDSKKKPGGFNPENDHRHAIGKSSYLQEKFKNVMKKKPPELCILVQPLPDKIEYAVKEEPENEMKPYKRRGRGSR
jgi:hypothetical protein